MPLLTSDFTRTFVATVPLAPLVPRASQPPRRSKPAARVRSATSGGASLTDTPPVELKSTDAQALVVGSGLVALAENVPSVTRADLVNCTLFAQLAASAAVGDSSQVIQWYDAYFKTLSALGWAQSDTQFEDYAFSSRNAEAHKAVMGVLTAALGPGAAALAVVQAAMNALQDMAADSPWITLFDRQSKVGKSARFQVATSQRDASGMLQIALVAFDLKASSNFTQVLFFKFASSSTTLRYASGRATIFEAALKEHRETIARRLNEYRQAYVAEIALPSPPGVVTRGGRPAAGAQTRGASGATTTAAALKAFLAPNPTPGKPRRRRR